MTQARFPSLVGLRLRAFGAKPPSELYQLLQLVYSISFVGIR